MKWCPRSTRRPRCSRAPGFTRRDHPAPRPRPWSSTRSRRDGALNLFAAFDTRSGQVYGQGHRRKRTAEFVAFLAFLDGQFGPEITCLHLVLDNLRTHKTKAVQAWLADHPRFVLHFTPVHCSWLNQVEQWFGLLQRKRLRIVDFASWADLERKLRQFIAEWNEHAHPFRWTTASFAKVLAGREEPAHLVALVEPNAVPALPEAA